MLETVKNALGLTKEPTPPTLEAAEAELARCRAEHEERKKLAMTPMRVSRTRGELASSIDVRAEPRATDEQRELDEKVKASAEQLAAAEERVNKLAAAARLAEHRKARTAADEERKALLRTSTSKRTASRKAVERAEAAHQVAVEALEGVRRRAADCAAAEEKALRRYEETGADEDWSAVQTAKANVERATIDAKRAKKVEAEASKSMAEARLEAVRFEHALTLARIEDAEGDDMAREALEIADRIEAFIGKVNGRLEAERALKAEADRLASEAGIEATVFQPKELLEVLCGFAGVVAQVDVLRGRAPRLEFGRRPSEPYNPNPYVVMPKHPNVYLCGDDIEARAAVLVEP